MRAADYLSMRPSLMLHCTAAEWDLRSLLTEKSALSMFIHRQTCRTCISVTFPTSWCWALWKVSAAVCDSTHGQESSVSQQEGQAAASLHHQPVTKDSVVITTKLRDANYHNSEHIISSSLNNLSSCKTEESAAKMQSDQHRSGYKKFSSCIRASNHDLENCFFLLCKGCSSLGTRTVCVHSVEKSLCLIILPPGLKHWWIRKISKEMPQFGNLLF